MIEYKKLINDAMLSVTKEAIRHLYDNNLFYKNPIMVSFATSHPEAKLPPHILKQYPKEITLEIGENYWDLFLEPDRIFVTLSFNRKKEQVCIPFNALTRFKDINADIRISLIPQEKSNKKYAEDEEFLSGSENVKVAQTKSKVVSLDAYKKRNSK